MNGEYLLYLQEIKKTEWVVELISEQFDDAMNMMTPNSVIYGGAVRDCLAGKNLIGDLDIAVSVSECTSMIDKFVKNPKWVNISNNKMNDAHYKMFDASPSLFGGRSRKSVFQTTPQIMTFRTLGNKTVQIIILSPTSDDPFQTVTTMVKQVDIVCCGVILTNDNKVFEVIPNAYKDCKKHVLHLNNANYVKDIEHFKQRVEKLSERGWINEININKVIRAVNRKRKQKIEQEKAFAGITKRASTKLESHTHTIERSNFVDSNNKDTIMENGYIVLRDSYTAQEGATGPERKYSYAVNTDLLTHTGYRSTLSGNDIGHVGGLSDTLHSLEAIAKKYRIDMIVQPIKNCLVLITKNRYISNQVHDRMLGEAKNSKRIPHLVSTDFEDAAPMYVTATNPPIKKKHKVSIHAMPYSSPKTATATDEQLYVQTSGKPLTPPFEIDKQTLSNLNKGKNLSRIGITRTEKYFNHSTDAKRSTTAIIDKYYQEVPRKVITRIGGIAVVLSCLEKLAKKFKMDIGVIMDKGVVTVVTKDDYAGAHIYDLLVETIYKPLKTNTEFSGGTIKWQ